MLQLEMDIEVLFILSKLRQKPFQEIALELSQKKVTLSEFKQIQDIKKLLEQGHPMAYILGTIEFLGLSFRIDKNTLIPRPETEEWVKNTITELKAGDSLINLLDLGTGSGVIGLSAWCLLGAHLQNLLMTDLSESALALARINLENLSQGRSVVARPKFAEADLFEGLKEESLLPFQLSQKNENTRNVLLSNLPYLPDSDQESLPNLAFEPAEALFSGEDGLDHFRKLIAQLAEQKLHFDLIVLELDPRNIVKARLLVEQIDFFKNYKKSIKLDFMGRNRILRLEQIPTSMSV